jgi:hypothetical protein
MSNMMNNLNDDYILQNDWYFSGTAANFKSKISTRHTLQVTTINEALMSHVVVIVLGDLGRCIVLYMHTYYEQTQFTAHHKLCCLGHHECNIMHTLFLNYLMSNLSHLSGILVKCVLVISNRIPRFKNDSYHHWNFLLDSSIPSSKES